ncbi:MAG: DinB family protein [Chloroflexi bacterium]|nr:DinB family protein [Chloroflexota bacterium]
MIDLTLLTKLFDFNAELIEKHTAGISHADSLKPLANRGNSLNWTLGHIISSRNLIFEHIPGEAVWSDAQRARYRNGSLNATNDDPGVLQLASLLHDFGISQQRLQFGLHHLPFEDLSKPTGYKQETVGGRLTYLQFHETHHVGQLMATAQAVGHDGGWLDDWTV